MTTSAHSGSLAVSWTEPPTSSISTVSAVSSSPREVARDALGGIGWGKRELVAWLEGPYRRVTVPAQDASPASRRSSLRPVADFTIAILLTTARAEVVAALENLMTGNTSFISEYQASGAVTARVLANGDVRAVATHRAGMRLVDRILSLFAADYLNDPKPYWGSLSVCEHCGHVSFEGECVHADSGVFATDEAEDEDEEPGPVSFIELG